MIISTDEEKALDKFHHPFMIKTLQKMGIKGIYLNNSKGHVRQTYGKHYSQW